MPLRRFYTALKHFRIRDFLWEMSLVYRTLFTKRPKSKFVVYGSARTGTTICASLLSVHEDLVSEHEIFNRFHTVAKKDFDAIYGEIGLGHTPPLFFPNFSIEKVADYKCNRLHRNCFSFKFLSSQMPFSREKKFMRKLAENGWKVLHVTREDLLHVAISYYLASLHYDKPGAWFGAKSQKAVVEPAKLIDLLERFDRELKEQREILRDIPHLDLVYEEDYLHVEKHQEVCDRIFHYLGMPSHPVHSPLKKQGSARLSERVENWEEVRDAVAATRFNVFLPQVAGSGQDVG